MKAVSAAMISLSTLGIAVAFLILSAGASASETTTQIITQGGPYHGDEIKAESGDGWLGLFPTDQGFELRKVSIEITKVHDGIMDDTPDVKTGKSIAIKPPSQQPSVILIRP